MVIMVMSERFKEAKDCTPTIPNYAARAAM